MKVNSILVAQPGRGIQFASGSVGVAVLPPKKGEKETFFLSAAGTLIRLDKVRMDGMGVSRFVAEQGFVPAARGDEQADKLARLVDVRQGKKLIEDATVAAATRLQATLGGKECIFVPFDSEKEPVSVKVEEPRGFTSVVYDLETGFNGGQVSLEWRLSQNLTGARMAGGWLLEHADDLSKVPRGTEYGGTIEKAVYVLCNAGLGELVGPTNLLLDEAAEVDEPCARGKMTVRMSESDLLVVGVDVMDTLHVRYVRNNKLLYSVSGTPASDGRRPPTLGDYAGEIGGVLVRIAELDAFHAPRLKKQGAARAAA